MLKTIIYYSIVMAGFGLTIASVFIVPTHPIWLLFFVPVLTVWSIWLIREYWNWVRKLGQ